MNSIKHWYTRPFGVAIILYLVITGSLALWFFATKDSGKEESIEFTASADQPLAIPNGIPPDVSLYTDDNASFGNRTNPKLVIVEFSDFQCPFCRKAYPIIRELATKYQDTLLYVYRDFPVEELHAKARRAAEAARCAKEQGKFWPYHDQIFLRQESLDEPSLVQYAEQVGLDRLQFTQCLAIGTYAGAVQKDIDDGLRLGVRGTPTWFFIPGGDVSKAQKVEGVIPRDKLMELLERVL